jgi:hypothetical protein
LRLDGKAASNLAQCGLPGVLMSSCQPKAEKDALPDALKVKTRHDDEK